MRRKNHNKSVQVKRILRNVLGDGGDLKSDSCKLETASTESIGRKQRRRNFKKAKKLKRLNYAQGKSSKVSEDELRKQKLAIKKLLRTERQTEDVKRRSGATQRKRKKEKLKAGKINQLKEDNKSEEKQITALEKLMHMNKAKTKKKNKLPSAFAEDGLDYILNTVSWQDDDSDVDGGIQMSDDEDLSSPGEKEQNDSEGPGTDSLQSGLSDEELIDDGDIVDDKSDTSDIEALSTTIEEQNVSSYKDDNAQETISLDTETGHGKYVPPAQRALAARGDVEKRRKIKRQLQGLLNRLSEANLHGICSSVQDIFNANSRAFVTEDITDLIMEQFCTTDPRPEKLIFETAMLMTVIGNNIGTSVIAHFVETVTKNMDKLLSVELYGGGKELNNLTHLLCSLYQLKAIQPKLLTDFVTIFTQRFREKDLELLILIMTQVGFQIRKEDPVTLKQVIENISKASSESETDGDLTRTKYMLEVLTAIKNNNIRKITGYDVELITNRRKRVKAASKDDSEEFPNVSLQDLLDADDKGRWWIVGSAWTGVPMLNKNKEQQQKIDVNSNVSSQLIEAARKLRMNTDVRRQIFYAALSSEDYLDAFGHILKLNLKGKQCREISHVLVECCQQQKSYNPFYYHLLRKFCRHDREFIMSLQCTFWDKFKLLDSMTDNHMKNITGLLAALIVSEDIPLSCLKAIEFSQINKQTVEFLRGLILKMLDVSDESNFSVPFAKLSVTKQTATKQGLRLFLQHFMIKDPNFMKLNRNYEERLISLEESLTTGKSYL